MQKPCRSGIRRGLMLIAAVLFLLSFSSPVLAAEQIYLLIDGRVILTEPPPFIQDGRTFVPVRGFAELLGAEVSWNAKNRTVTVRRGAHEVLLRVGDLTAWVNGEQMVFDAPPQIVADRVFVPLRFLAEALGAGVTWMPPNSIVIETGRVSATPGRSGSRRDAVRLGEMLSREAAAYIGYPYAWGGGSPDSGFDCSGFTQFIASKFGIKLPRTTEEQAAAGVRVSRQQLMNGDLVFFHTYGPPGQPTHVGFYKDGYLIHAQNEQTGVVSTPLTDEYWSSRLLFGVRITMP